MCGIAGIAAAASAEPAPLENTVRRMLPALRHRGPDDQGWECTGDAAVWLANTRLAILDPSAAGHQPMRDAASGNWIAMNGEIYNFRALRTELGGGHWASDSDTEVVLRAYARWGVGAFARLRGMFAVAIWDAASSRLVLARDRFGIKPLYYRAAADRVVFASEVRALLASGAVPRRFSPDGLASFLMFGSVSDPHTIVDGVWSLPPGHLLIARPRAGTVETALQHWAPPATEWEPPPGAAAEAVRDVLQESIAAHLVSDVPLGAFLSGGLDSNAVVGLMSRAAAQPVRTFTVVFAERSYSEAARARAVAERFATEHTEIPLADSELLAMLPEALGAMDQPSYDGINTFVLARAVRQAGVKVALSGLGADELFGGYPSFARLAGMARLQRVPVALRGAIAAAVGAAARGTPRAAKAAALLTAATPADVYLLSRTLFGAADLEALGVAVPHRDADYLPDVPTDAAPRSALSLLELRHYMGNTLLRDTDCMSMASGLEVRVPFVDAQVVGTALALAAPAHGHKGLLRAAVADLLPARFGRRAKMGFTLPFAVWMQDGLRGEIEAVLGDPHAGRQIGLATGSARAVWQQFEARPRAVGWSRPWALYVLARWAALHGMASA